MTNKTLIFALFLALGLVALPHGGAEAAVPGELIKGSGPTIFYVAFDGKRYAFPDEGTYKTWYSNFSGIRLVSDQEMAKTELGGVVTVRPGVRPVAFASDSRVYGVAKGGQLRWLTSPTIAAMIFGKDWHKNVLTLPSGRMTDYTVGAPVTGPAQYWWFVERDSAQTVWDDRAASNGKGRVVFNPNTPKATLAAAETNNGTLILHAELINDNGSSVKLDAVDFSIDGVKVYPDEGNPLAQGGYTVYAAQLPGYKVGTWKGDCVANATNGTVAAVFVPKGQTRYCTISYDDMPGGIWGSIANRPPMLTLYGPRGTKLFIGSMEVVGGSSTLFNPGDYTVYASPMGRWTGDCTPTGTINLKNGDERQCILER
jgi:hypothetical protein